MRSPIHKLAMLLLWLTPAVAVGSKDAGPFVDGTLVSMKTVSDGMHCTTTANGDAAATSDRTATTSSRTSTNCTPRQHALYTIRVGEQTLVVMPEVSAAKVGTAMLTLGVSNAFAKESCLYGALPGTPFKIRVQGGSYHVRLGKRESVYKLVSAE